MNGKRIERRKAWEKGRKKLEDKKKDKKEGEMEM